MRRLILTGLGALLTAAPSAAQLPRTSHHVLLRSRLGQQTAPTLSAALRWIADARAAGDDSPATILLGQQTYSIREPITLDAALVGEGLELAAAPSCSPTISGGQQISALRAHPDGSWRATLEDVAAGDWWFEELFVADQPAVRARHPNRGFARVVEAAADNRTGFSFDPAELPPELLDNRSEVVFIHDWSTSRMRIRAADPASNSLSTTHPIGCKATHYAITNFEPHPRFFIEGSPLLVDAPGEWALDRVTGELTYRPRPGESIESVRMIAPRAPALLRATGTIDAPLRGLVVRGIRFAHANWPVPAYGYAEGQAAFYEQRDRADSDGTRDAVAAAIELAWAEDCSFERCVIELVGGTGLWIGAGCQRCLVSDCHVGETGANGIMFGEASGRELDSEPWWQMAPEQAASGNTVRHCLIERCGRRFFGAVGIWIGLAEKTAVDHCEIRELPYTGVSVGWRWDETPTPCRENTIEANNIHHVMQVLSDGGGIYTLGLQPDTRLAGNAIHDIRRNAGRAPSNGMFLDQGTSKLLIEENVFWGIDTTPLRWHMSYANTVRQNVFVLHEDQRMAYYNRASPEDISYVGNVTEDAGSWSEANAEAIVTQAGVRE